MPDRHGPDYAVPAALPSSRRRSRGERGPVDDVLWGGRPRRLVMVGAWVAALLLALPLVLPVLVPDETGADSPEAAVTAVLRGIADLDPVAIVAMVDPAEVDDPQRTGDAYAELGDHIIRLGDEVPPDVTALLNAIEAQVAGAADLDALAILAAIDLDLDEELLRLDRVAVLSGDEYTVVELNALRMRVTLDPDRLDDPPAGLSASGYDVPLERGWQMDGSPVEPVLVTVEREGRWYVSVVATRGVYLGPPGARTDG